MKGVNITTDYERLLIEAEDNNLLVKEKPLLAYDGRIKGNRIAIKNSLSSVSKACVLAEELGHYYTTIGDILSQADENEIKQELRARIWAYDRLIGLSGIIKGYNANCCNISEFAEYLNVSEQFLQEALNYYRAKYGTHTRHEGYIIIFYPNLNVTVYNNSN